MAASAARKITLTYTGDVTGVETLSATANAASPAQIQIVTLSVGDNTITVPGGGSTPKACTILKPAGNTSAIKIKGVGGDTGVRLSDTEPDSISLDASQTTFILNVATAQIVGLRLYWT